MAITHVHIHTTLRVELLTVLLYEYEGVATGQATVDGRCPGGGGTSNVEYIHTYMCRGAWADL